jgi:hypothetical protein
MQSGLDNLKHSIRTHLAIMQGPTPQLSAYLIKLIDLMEDTDQVRKASELDLLSFVLIEAVALYVHQSVNARAAQTKAKGRDFPASVVTSGDNLLVMVGKCRSLPDKLVAKLALCRAVAETLRSLSTFTNAKYPDITDINGNIL